MKKKIIDFVLVSFGAFLCAFSTRSFLLPFKISPGGFSGIAQLLFYLFQIPLSLTTLLLNSVLLFASYRKFSFQVLIKNLCGILLLSLFLSLLDFLPPIATDPFLAAVFGGALAGAGVGIVLLRGSSTGGTDLFALLVHSLVPYLSLAFLILFFDLLIIFVSGFLLNDFSLILYSALSLYIGSRTTDFVLTKGDFAKSLVIMTEDPEKLSYAIMENTGRGITGLYTYSFFQKKDKKALFCVVKSRQLPKVLAIIEGIEPGAFTIISDARQVRGKGFRETL